MNPFRYTLFLTAVLCGCASQTATPSVAPKTIPPTPIAPTERELFETALKTDIEKTIDLICRQEDKFKDEITYPALLERWKFNLGALTAKYEQRTGMKPNRRESAEFIRFLYVACMDYSRERRRLPSDFTANDASALAQFALDAKVPVWIERPDATQIIELENIKKERARLQAEDTTNRLKLGDRLKDINTQLATIEAKQQRAKAAEANRLALQIPPLIEEQTRLQNLMATKETAKALQALDAREKDIRSKAMKAVLVEELTGSERANLKP